MAAWLFRAARSRSCSPTSRDRLACSMRSALRTPSTRRAPAPDSWGRHAARRRRGRHAGRRVPLRLQKRSRRRARRHGGADALAETPVRVRMGIHTGEPTLTDEGYVGLDVHRGARICAAATAPRSSCRARPRSARWEHRAARPGRAPAQGSCRGAAPLPGRRRGARGQLRAAAIGECAVEPSASRVAADRTDG